MGKLIVIEGSDGSGKTTQLGMLCEYLTKCGTDYRKLEFPCYAEPTSALVRMYLGGQFGENVGDVNAYAASSFYAVDRVGSYLADWKKDYDAGKILVSGRYTTSNVIHQGAKMEESERDGYFEWLYDYEYNLLGIPKPDAVIFLDLPPELAIANIKSRGEQVDIHEKDTSYMIRCYECASYAADKLGWIRISCAENGKMLSIEQIHEKIKTELSAKGILN